MPGKRFSFTVLLFFVLVSLLAMPVFAATSASFVFDTTSDPGDLPDGPDFIVTAVGPVDDTGSGCDSMVMIMVDPNGVILDIDTFCIILPGVTGGSDGDYGSFGAGFLPTAGPATYALFDIDATDIAALTGFGDNDQEYYDYIVANVPVAAEAYFDIPGFVSGTPFSFLPPAPGGAAVPTGCRLNIPAGSVVGEAPLGAQVFWSPGNESPGVVLNPGTYIVVGQDESETFYQIFLACQFVWVRKDAMQPSYLPPQNGTPLPTRIVG